MARAEAGEGAGRVEAYEPIRLGTAFSGVGKVGHLLALAQCLPSFLDRSCSHRLHPEAFDWLFDLTNVHYVLENQLTLSASITSIYNHIELFLLSKIKDVFKATSALFDWLKLKLLWNGG